MPKPPKQRFHVRSGPLNYILLKNLYLNSRFGNYSYQIIKKNDSTKINMVKMGKNKLKLLNKSPKADKNETKLVGKITKKKTGVKDPTAEKKKASIIKELATKSSDLVNVKENKQLRFAKSLVSKDERKPPQPKQKPVEKQKKRQKTQIDDTKMLLKLMKKK